MAVTVTSFEEDTVTKVATNVTSGVINRHSSKGRGMTYLATIRATGQAAPSLATVKDEGLKLFSLHPEQEIIDNTTAIDIYCICSDGGATDKIGKLVIWT